MSERDTHFQGFAKLLFEQLYNSGDVWFDDLEPYWHEHWQQIIAQRAYDLMEHIMLYAPAAPVPDLTEWPDEEDTTSSAT